jgi:hypothetical protein
VPGLTVLHEGNIIEVKCGKAVFICGNGTSDKTRPVDKLYHIPWLEG